MSNTLDRRRVRGNMLEVDNLYGTAFTGEENAHIFRITDYEGSTAVAFTGEIAGKFINPAGVTVPLSGSLDEDGRALVTLDEHCYAVEGRFILTIWSGSEVIYCGVGQVMNSQTDTIDYPTAGIPDVAALIQQLQTILNNWPADYSQLQSDVSNLKSALRGVNISGVLTVPGAIYSNGTNRNSSSIDNAYLRSDYIKIYSGQSIWYKNLRCLSNNLVVAIYYNDKTIDSNLSVAGTGTAAYKSGEVLVNHDGFVRFATMSAYISEIEINIFITDRQLLIPGMAADAGAVRDNINYQFSSEQHGLYEEQYQKNNYTMSWIQCAIRLDVGDVGASDYHICSGYIPIFNNIPISIDAPDNYRIVVCKYTTQSYSNYTGYDGNACGKQRKYVNNNYARIDVSKADGTTILPADGDNITVSYYADKRYNDIVFNNTEVKKQLEQKTITAVWEQGSISVINGSAETSQTTIRTNYITIKGGSSFFIEFPTNFLISVFEYDRQSVDDYIGTIIIGDNSGYFGYSVESDTSFRITVSEKSNTSIVPATGSYISISQYFSKKDLNILVIGNSFSMDSFAYLPPVLSEALPEYNVNYGVAYTSSASIDDHVMWYNNNTKYTLYWEWNERLNKWRHFTSTGDLDRGKTLTDIMALRAWDIIYVQPASEVTSPELIERNIIEPGRELLRILQGLALRPFTFLMGEWMGTLSEDPQYAGDHGDHVFGLIAAAMEQTQRALGIDGVIPIGAAIQDARSNSTFQTLGSWVNKNMLYSDGIHMQSGIAPLIAAYTIAKYILRLIGMKRGLFASTFVPTTENCIAINAYSTTFVRPMTHGESDGVTTENIRAAQEIASFAVRYPDEVIDCSHVIDSSDVIDS